MLSNLSNLALSTLTYAQKANWGVKGLIIGLGSVFVILVVLIIVINLLKVTSSKNANVSSDKSVAANISPIGDGGVNDKDEIIAVIAAAVNCMAQREGKRFAIKSFKRVGSRYKRSY